jgi:hypothetical protein
MLPIVTGIPASPLGREGTASTPKSTIELLAAIPGVDKPRYQRAGHFPMFNSVFHPRHANFNVARDASGPP